MTPSQRAQAIWRVIDGTGTLAGRISDLRDLQAEAPVPPSPTRRPRAIPGEHQPDQLNNCRQACADQYNRDRQSAWFDLARKNRNCAAPRWRTIPGCNPFLTPPMPGEIKSCIEDNVRDYNQKINDLGKQLDECEDRCYKTNPPMHNPPGNPNDGPPVPADQWPEPEEHKEDVDDWMPAPVPFWEWTF